MSQALETLDFCGTAGLHIRRDLQPADRTALEQSHLIARPSPLDVHGLTEMLLDAQTGGAEHGDLVGRQAGLIGITPPHPTLSPLKGRGNEEGGDPLAFVSDGGLNLAEIVAANQEAVRGDVTGHDGLAQAERGLEDHSARGHIVGILREEYSRDLRREHGLDVHGGAPGTADFVVLTVGHGSFGVPRAEDGVDAFAEQCPRVGGKRTAGRGLVDGQGGLDRLSGRRLSRYGESVGPDVRHGPGEGANELQVRQPERGRIVQFVRQSGMQSAVEQSVHHAGHGHGRSGTHRDQQRRTSAPETTADSLFQPGQMGAYLLFQPDGPLLGVVEEGPAALGGDGEAGGDRQASPAHGGQAGPLASEQVLLRRHLARLTRTKGIDPARCDRGYRVSLPFTHTNPFLSVPK